MKLTDCTAPDLVWIIKNLDVKEERINALLDELERAREEYKVKEAGRVRDLIEQKEKEYAELMSPYASMQSIAIPVEVHKKAHKLSAIIVEAKRRLEWLQG